MCYLSLGRPIQAVQVSKDFATLVTTILPIARQDVERVWQLMVKYPGLGCRDYFHIAVMLNNNITHVLSADTHFDRVSELVRVSPREFAGR
jgi:predicted nucleic acid-binding protein